MCVAGHMPAACYPVGGGAHATSDSHTVHACVLVVFGWPVLRCACWMLAACVSWHDLPQHMLSTSQPGDLQVCLYSCMEGPHIESHIISEKPLAAVTAAPHR